MAKKKVTNENQGDLFKRKPTKKARVDTSVPQGPVVPAKIYDGLNAYELMAEFQAAVNGLNVKANHETHIGILRIETAEMCSYEYAMRVLADVYRVIEKRNIHASVSLSIRSCTLGDERCMIQIKVPAPVEIDFVGS